jgi:hypothetical protein
MIHRILLGVRLRGHAMCLSAFDRHRQSRKYRAARQQLNKDVGQWLTWRKRQFPEESTGDVGRHWGQVQLFKYQNQAPERRACHLGPPHQRLMLSLGGF